MSPLLEWAQGAAEHRGGLRLWGQPGWGAGSGAPRRSHSPADPAAPPRQQGARAAAPPAAALARRREASGPGLGHGDARQESRVSGPGGLGPGCRAGGRSVCHSASSSPQVPAVPAGRPAAADLPAQLLHAGGAAGRAAAGGHRPVPRLHGVSAGRRTGPGSARHGPAQPWQPQPWRVRVCRTNGSALPGGGGATADSEAPPSVPCPLPSATRPGTVLLVTSFWATACPVSSGTGDQVPNSALWAGGRAF